MTYRAREVRRARDDDDDEDDSAIGGVLRFYPRPKTIYLPARYSVFALAPRRFLLTPTPR